MYDFGVNDAQDEFLSSPEWDASSEQIDQGTHLLFFRNLIEDAHESFDERLPIGGFVDDADDFLRGGMNACPREKSNVVRGVFSR